MPSETFQRADLDLLLSVRVDVARVPGGASQRQILDAVRTFRAGQGGARQQP